MQIWTALVYVSKPAGEYNGYSNGSVLNRMLIAAGIRKKIAWSNFKWTKSRGLYITINWFWQFEHVGQNNKRSSYMWILLSKKSSKFCGYEANGNDICHRVQFFNTCRMFCFTVPICRSLCRLRAQTIGSTMANQLDVNKADYIGNFTFSTQIAINW